MYPGTESSLLLLLQLGECCMVVVAVSSTISPDAFKQLYPKRRSRMDLLYTKRRCAVPWLGKWLSPQADCNAASLLRHSHQECNYHAHAS